MKLDNASLPFCLFVFVPDQPFLSSEKEANIYSDFLGGCFSFFDRDLMFSLYFKKCLVLKNC